MKRIGIVGIPSTGKTTLARHLAGSLAGSKFKNIELINEYARGYISKYGFTTSPAEQLLILDNQLKAEDSLPEQTDLLITDSPIFLGFMYGLDIAEEGNMKDAKYINSLFSKMNNLNQPKRYDIIFYLPDKLTKQEDGVRPEQHLDPVWRKEAEKKLNATFTIFPSTHYIEITSVEIAERTKECIKHLNNLL